MATLELSDIASTDPATLAVDAVVIGIAPAPDDSGGVRLASGSERVDAAFDRRLAETLSALGASGKREEITKTGAMGKLAAPILVAVGLGDEPLDLEALRRASGAAVRNLAGTARVGLALPASSALETAAVAEGALLGAYAFLRYRTTSRDDHRSPVASITVLTPDPKARKETTDRARVLTDAVVLARDLVNTPPSHLHPEEFVTIARDAARDAGLEIDVLDEAALRESGYGGIIAVGQGSTHSPRLARISYRHPEAERTAAFVGKGITFDSGGLSLKPSASMDWMKSDMAGAAAVLGALVAIARLRPKVNVVGYLSLAENMPSGTAQRPSDVVTIYGGKTVEVLNTDAEGRLVLADAIVRAAEDDPQTIVDAATLTGAQLVALGTRTAGVMSNDDDLAAKIVDAGARAGDPIWPMPLPAELRKSLDSEVADIANVGDRYGGMLIGGIFLKEFVPDGVRWAHLDIAGPAFNKGEPFGYTPKGGTGAATRTFVQIAEDLAAGKI